MNAYRDESESRIRSLEAENVALQKTVAALRRSRTARILEAGSKFGGLLVAGLFAYCIAAGACWMFAPTKNASGCYVTMDYGSVVLHAPDHRELQICSMVADAKKAADELKCPMVLDP